MGAFILAWLWSYAIIFSSYFNLLQPDAYIDFDDLTAKANKLFNHQMAVEPIR